MHSTEIEYGGETFTLHYNGDHSGDVIVTTRKANRIIHHQGNPEFDIPDTHDFYIPFEVMEEFVGRAMISRVIEKLESLSGKEYLEVKAAMLRL